MRPQSGHHHCFPPTLPLPPYHQILPQSRATEQQSVSILIKVYPQGRTGSYITRITKLQLGHVAMSS